MADVINTWEQGWHSDNDPIDQPKGTYRNMSAMNLITKNGNNFSAETQQGTIVSFQIPAYVNSSTHTFTLPQARFTPIGFFSFIDKLVVIATNDESATGGNGMYGVVTFGQNGIGTWDTLFYSPDLFYTKQNRIDGYALNETPSINRVYTCDILNNPRVVNITSPAFAAVGSTELIYNPPAVNKYIVVQGQVGYEGILYGPGEIAGTVFTTTYTGGTSYAPTSDPNIPTAKVINFVSVNSITIQPPATVGEIDYKETTRDGSQIAGMKAFTFRLKSTTGKVTTFGPISKPVHVSPSTPSPSISGYQNYIGAGINNILITTNAAITITISDLPFNDFQFIDVVAIEYDQKIEVIRSITQIAELPITSSSIDVKYLGGENLAIFTVDDLTAIETIIVSAKAMATFKMRGFMANLKERAEFTSAINGIGTVHPFTYQIPADNLGGQSYQSYTYESTTTLPLLNIAVDGKYKVSNGNVEYPSGSGTTYGTNAPTSGTDVFIGVANQTGWTVTSGVPDIIAIIRIRKYIPLNGGPDVFKDIEVLDEYLDYKGEAVHHYLMGHWRDETYRIGFLGFDKYRQPFFVRWLDDIHIPSQSTTFANGSPTTGDGGLINVYPGTNIHGTFDNDAQTSLNIMGIQIDNLILPSEIIDKLDSFAIVRSPRDKQILTQGQMCPTAKLVNDFRFAAPLATYDPSVDANCFLDTTNKGGTFPGYFTLKSPEIQSNNPDFLTNLVLQSGDILKPVARYTALLPWSDVTGLEDPNGTGIYPMYDIQSESYQWFSKWYHHTKYVGNDGMITRYTFVEMHQTITAFDGTHDFINSNALTKNYPSPIHPLSRDNGAGLNDIDATATGGRSGLFWTQNELDYINSAVAGVPEIWKNNENQKLLANWVRPKSVLYGGQSESAIALSEYLYCGHIQKIDAKFKTDNLAASGPNIGKYVISGIQVFGGDCLVTIYDNVINPYDDHNSVLAFGFSYGSFFPIETTLDTVLRQGRHFAKDGLQLPAAGNGVVYSLTVAGPTNYSRPEQYDVNSAYSTSDELDFKYPALPLGFNGDGIFPARVRYSNVKTIGEVIDSQRIYLPNNFRDVDTNHGEINNLKVGVDRLFYWQNKGVGYLPVDEREIVNGSLGSAVQLGVGGVLQRFDNMDIYFGNQHQWSMIETPDRFYWFDMRRKALCYLNFGGQTVEFSTVSGLQSFFNNRFTAIETMASPNIFDSDQPIMGRGISGWYDSRFETAYMTFKLRPIAGEEKYNFGDFTVSISKQLNEFIGQHPFTPGIACEFNGNSLSVITNVTSLLNGVTYAEGDLVTEAGIQYVCIKGYTNTLFTPVSADPTNWKYNYDSIFSLQAGSKIDDVNVHWRGDTAKFYGRVYDSSIEIVVNAQGESVSFDNYEAYGNEFNFDDVIVNSSQLSGSDLSVLPTNRNYRYYDGSWKASYPLSSANSRFFDKYIIVKFVKHNNVVGDITTSLNQVKRLVFLKTTLRPKK